MDKTKFYTVAVPRRFEPLILAEMERLGVDTRTACLAHVLQGYFDATQLNEVEQPVQEERNSGDTGEDADRTTEPRLLFTFATRVRDSEG